MGLNIQCLTRGTTLCQSKDDDKQGAIRCFKDEKAAMNALIAHVVFEPATDTFKQDNNNGC